MDTQDKQDAARKAIELSTKNFDRMMRDGAALVLAHPVEPAVVDGVVLAGPNQFGNWEPVAIGPAPDDVDAGAVAGLDEFICPCGKPGDVLEVAGRKWNGKPVEVEVAKVTVRRVYQWVVEIRRRAPEERGEIGDRSAESDGSGKEQ